jgi:hypothetical protein
VQLNDVSGEAATWHVRQTGPTFVDGAKSSWQVPQLAGNAAADTPKWAGSLYGTACVVPPPPPLWHSVLLKHPAAVPAGAGGLGDAIGEFSPFRWQKTHAEAFPSAVVVWT